MKRFEYMLDLREQFQKSGMKDFGQYLNKLGSEGWDVEFHYQQMVPSYFAKREITDEPVTQRTVRREMEYSRA